MNVREINFNLQFTIYNLDVWNFSYTQIENSY